MKYQSLLLSIAILAGCSSDNSPPPPRAEVPPPEARNVPRRESEPIKPLPDQTRDHQVVAPPFDDAPLLNQPVPEAPAFVEAWNRVGRPRITVFMNRTLEGKIIPVNPNEAAVPVDVQQNRNETPGGDNLYLGKGQYDEAYAKSLDYEAMENTLTDWVACNSQVTMVAPMMARQKLTDQQVKDLKEGRPQVLRELAEQLDVDVLIHLQAHPSQQSQEGLKIRVIAEAINTKGGESLGRAVVDISPPLEKQKINRFTRFLASKLMDGMIGAWYAPQPEKKAEQSAPPEQNVAPTPPPVQTPAPPSTPPAPKPEPILPAPPRALPPATAPSTQPH